MMKVIANSAVTLWLAAGTLSVQAQTQSHVDTVRLALKSAYAISDSTNKCPVARADMFGWPAKLVRYCEYQQGRHKGVVYLLAVQPEQIAQWIETSCSKRMPGQTDCFRVVLECGRRNSGMMFPISGNIIEDDLNYFFRNGITVVMSGFPHASSRVIGEDLQRSLAEQSNELITRIPTGLARYWRTLPRHFAALYPDKAAPPKVDQKEERQKWLEIVRTEVLLALETPENTLLEAYMAAYPTSLRSLLGKRVIKEDDCPME
jgi:hypothetical protein